MVQRSNLRASLKLLIFFILIGNNCAHSEANEHDFKKLPGWKGFQISGCPNPHPYITFRNPDLPITSESQGPWGFRADIVLGGSKNDEVIGVIPRTKLVYASMELSDQKRKTFNFYINDCVGNSSAWGGEVILSKTNRKDPFEWEVKEVNLKQQKRQIWSRHRPDKNIAYANGFGYTSMAESSQPDESYFVESFLRKIHINGKFYERHSGGYSTGELFGSQQKRMIVNECKLKSMKKRDFTIIPTNGASAESIVSANCMLLGTRVTNQGRAFTYIPYVFTSGEELLTGRTVQPYQAMLGFKRINSPRESSAPIKVYDNDYNPYAAKEYEEGLFSYLVHKYDWLVALINKADQMKVTNDTKCSALKVASEILSKNEWRLDTERWASKLSPADQNSILTNMLVKGNCL